MQMKYWNADGIGVAVLAVVALLGCPHDRLPAEAPAGEAAEPSAAVAEEPAEEPAANRTIAPVGPSQPETAQVVDGEVEQACERYKPDVCPAERCVVRLRSGPLEARFTASSGDKDPLGDPKDTTGYLRSAYDSRLARLTECMHWRVEKLGYQKGASPTWSAELTFELPVIECDGAPSDVSVVSSTGGVASAVERCVSSSLRVNVCGGAPPPKDQRPTFTVSYSATLSGKTGAWKCTSKPAPATAP